MNERAKIMASHLSRQAIVYLRQSSDAQVENNRESMDRQYALATKARDLGWPGDRVIVIDEDLGLSGSGSVARSGFARLTAEVALARVGLVLGLEVSRLARNNADWHRLIDLAGLTDTLIGDADSIYHPALFNDRLLLGLKGTMSEAELHVLRVRLNGGIRNKAARGELRRGLPVGFVWGEADGEVPSTGTRPLSQPSATYSRASPRRVPLVVSGYGSARKGSHSRCRCTRAPRSAGSRRATPPSTMC
jgi:DNA invertase Pin-like site-specific DNA recombinase